MVATHRYHHASTARFVIRPSSPATTYSEVGMLLRRYASTIAMDVANNEDECETTTSSTVVATVKDAMNHNTNTFSSSLGDNGYLGKILNAKVYDVAIETELQHAENLSQVSSCAVDIAF